ncbi:MAG TPA: ribonuclease HI [Longilinea sp.]|nr:ribonuclease HI [Longilinea sp.]
MNLVTIYTDGACTGNPGPGGYGAVVVNGHQRQELSGGFRMTTNNRMELMAAIEALKSLIEPSKVKLYSDSKYLVDAMTLGWTDQWKSNRWRNSSKQKVSNSDLWKELLQQCSRHQVTFAWVQGHAGNRENERCDYLSTTAARRRNLPPDKGYEGKTESPPALF